MLSDSKNYVGFFLVVKLEHTGFKLEGVTLVS